jgi:AcrR family transcriptional regulator
MGRWEPNAQGRLAEAAMELYSERGYEGTTVAEIAARAGLTERTFFRYYADKREVLFDGGGQMQELLAGAAAAAPEGAEPIDAAAVGLQAVATALDERRGRDFARRRQAVIAANPELQERELSKLASWSEALAGAVEERGVPAATARLVGEVALAVFRAAFESWVADGESRDLGELVRVALAELKMAVG